jgi:transcriptional regulator with XRE-family HTH domain
LLFIPFFCFTFVKSNKIWSATPILLIVTKMKDRIRQLMESQHMTQQSFASFLGMSPAILSSIFNGRTKPTLNTVEAIKSKIPTISTDWLVFGKGEMYKSETQVDNSQNMQASDNEETALDFDDSQSVFSDPSPVISSHQNERPRHEVIKHEVKYIDKPQRKITEIRVYFDDQTYETFEPKK